MQNGFWLEKRHAFYVNARGEVNSVGYEETFSLVDCEVLECRILHLQSTAVSVKECFSSFKSLIIVFFVCASLECPEIVLFKRDMRLEGGRSGVRFCRDGYVVKTSE